MTETQVSASLLSSVADTLPCMCHLWGYARVSTAEQDPPLQHDALQGPGCARIETDRASGALSSGHDQMALAVGFRPGVTV